MTGQPNEIVAQNRYDWAISKLEAIKKVQEIKVVYDIGGRDAIMKARIEALGINYYGFDLFPLDGSIRKWDIEEEFPYNELPKPDVIIMLEVIEHLRNPWLGISNLSRLLSSGSSFILTTPNPHWSRSRFDLLLNNYLSCFTVSDLKNNHHVFTPWPHIVEKLLDDCNLEIKKYAAIDGRTRLFGKPINILFPIVFFFRLFQFIIENKDNKAIGMSYGIVSEKKG